jgi:hypothetical protein
MRARRRQRMQAPAAPAAYHATKPPRLLSPCSSQICLARWRRYNDSLGEPSIEDFRANQETANM